MPESLRVSGVHHIAIQTRDLERSRAFYCELLGMNEVRRQPHSIWVQAAAPASVILMLEKCDGKASEPPWSSPRPGPHLVALTIDVKDRVAWAKRLASAGVPLVKESGYSLYVRDPDGTRVGLSHYPVSV